MSLKKVETWSVDTRLLFLQSVSTLLALRDLSLIKLKFCCSVQVQTFTPTLSAGPLSFPQHKKQIDATIYTLQQTLYSHDFTAKRS
jgi:hypothetical protein